MHMVVIRSRPVLPFGDSDLVGHIVTQVGAHVGLYILLIHIAHSAEASFIQALMVC